MSIHHTCPNWAAALSIQIYLYEAAPSSTQGYAHITEEYTETVTTPTKAACFMAMGPYLNHLSEADPPSIQRYNHVRMLYRMREKYTDTVITHTTVIYFIAIDAIYLIARDTQQSRHNKTALLSVYDRKIYRYGNLTLLLSISYPLPFTRTAQMRQRYRASKDIPIKTKNLQTS